MRKLLGTLALVAIVVAVVGSSRDWFSVKRTRNGDDTHLQIRIDRSRIRSDAKSAAQVARELGDNLEDRIDRRLDTAAGDRPETTATSQ